MDEASRIAERLQHIDDPLALLSGLLAHAPVALQVFEAGGRSVFVNRAFRELFGLEPPPGYNILTDEVLKTSGYPELILSAFAGNTIHIPPHWYDPRGLRHVTVTEGRRVALQVTAFPLFHRSGSIQHVALCFKDVTAEMELTQLHDQVRQREQEVSATLNSIGDGVLATDTAGNVVRMNPVAEALTGLACADAIGKPLPEVFRGKPDPSAARPTSSAAHPNSLLGPAQETVLLGEGACERVISTSRAPIRGDDGLLRGVVLVLRDITERKRAEELQRRSAELVEQNRIILAANRTKSEFLANMSHELRTPLNAVLGFAELLHDDKVGQVSADQREYLGDILDSGRHLLSLINGVLDLAKVESGLLEFHPEPVNLAALLAEVKDVLRALAAQKRIRIQSSVEPELGVVTADPARLRQVLYNYLSNALKFSHPESTVTVRIMSEGSDAFRIEVEDSGIGIRPEDLGKLFAEFQQIDAGITKRYEGTGLGLVLTKRIVEAQGGQVSVTSTFGKGSLFTATLPRNLSAGRLLQSGAPPALDAARLQPTVLVVEDEANDQAWLRQALSEGGYLVETASSGREALSQCQARTFDAITLDLLLPDMSGLDVLRAVRNAGRNRDTPVIVATVIKDREAIAGMPVHDVLLKPVSKLDLLSTLERAGAQHNGGRKVLIVDDDPAALVLMEAALREVGYPSVSFSDAAQALRCAEHERFSAVILDLFMPEMDGFEFLRRLRSTQLGRGVPVIVWTVKELSAEERELLTASAQAIIVKNSATGRSALLSELNKHLRGQGTGVLHES